MTGGGDPEDVLGEIADETADELEDDDTIEGDDVAPPVAEPDLHLNLNDPDPSAGASDVGGRAGSVDDEG